jgi:hypothetical protein
VRANRLRFAAGCVLVLVSSAALPAHAGGAQRAPAAGGATAAIYAAVRGYVGGDAVLRVGHCPPGGCGAAVPVVVVGEPVVRGDRATVYVAQYRAALAGTGRTLLLERAGGEWQVVPAARTAWANWS